VFFYYFRVTNLILQLSNNINFGTVTGNPLSKDINDIISPTLGDKGETWTKNNLDLADSTTADIEKTMITLNDFDGSEFEKVLPKSAAFIMKNEQLTLVSATKRSKEDPIDPEKLTKAQKELDELVEKVNKFYLIVPKFGEDKNINDLMMKRIQELGNDGVNVTVKSSSNLERIKEDGTIDYFYRDPNNSGNGLWFEFSDIVFELSKDGAKVETIGKRVRMDWDLEKLEAALKENVVDALTDDVLKNKNASLSEVETDLELPKYANNVKWATITWTSSNPSAIAVVDDTSKPFAPFNGKVKQAKETQKVTLTATIKNNRGTFPLNLTKSFDVTVKGLGNSLSNDMEELMATYYTDEKLKDSITKEVVDLNHVSNDITLPTPSATGIPGSFNYKFEAESDTNDNVEAKGFRVKVYRPLPGEKPVKTSFKVKMIDRKTDIFVEKTYHITIDPLTHEEIAKEVSLMDFAKSDFQRALNNTEKTSKAALLDTLSSEPTNKLSNEVDSNLTPMRQVIYSKNGTGFEWIYDMDKVTTSGISPVSVDVTRPSEQWDKFLDQAIML
ncbi:MAG: immunoglobulin-like domain-containing protein, partial [Vagococcus sp.]